MDYLTSTICSKVGRVWKACHGAKRTKCPCKFSPSPVPYISPCTCHFVHMNMLRAVPCTWYFYCVLVKCSTYLFLLLVTVFSFKIQQYFLESGSDLHLIYPKVQLCSFKVLKFFFSLPNRTCQRCTVTGSYAGADGTAGASD